MLSASRSKSGAVRRRGLCACSAMRGVLAGRPRAAEPGQVPQRRRPDVPRPACLRTVRLAQCWTCHRPRRLASPCRTRSARSPSVPWPMSAVSAAGIGRRPVCLPGSSRPRRSWPLLWISPDGAATLRSYRRDGRNGGAWPRGLRPPVRASAGISSVAASLDKSAVSRFDAAGLTASLLDWSDGAARRVRCCVRSGCRDGARSPKRTGDSIVAVRDGDCG